MENKTIILIILNLTIFSLWTGMFLFGAFYLPIYYAKIPELIIVTMPFFSFIYFLGLLERCGCLEKEKEEDE